MKPVLVSILIPVYNRENIISHTIDSAISQTHTNIEIVIVDNCSTDGTWEILQAYASKDERIKIFRNESNIGPVRNWLACVERASGLYSKILWSDDLIHPEFLAKLLPFFNDRTVGFVYSSAVIFSGSHVDSGANICTRIASGIHDSSVFVEGALLGDDFPVSPGCAVFKTADLKENLLLHVPNGVGSDFSMHAIGNDLLAFLLTTQKYKSFAVVNEPLAYFRAHEGSISVAASSGKIPLHYDLAKGYFAENYINDSRLKAKLSALFLVHLIIFNAKPFGIFSLSDFYPSKGKIKFNLFYFAIAIAKAVFRILFRR